MAVHPEDERLAGAGPRELTLYTSAGCHLCEEARAALEPLLHEFCLTLREVNVNDDPLLLERYGREVPVIFLGARKAAKHQVDVAQLRRKIEYAR